MTNTELRRDWKQYALEVAADVWPDYPERTIKLKDIFIICYDGVLKGGLLFDSGGEQGPEAVGAILRVDEENNCYGKSDLEAPAEEGWKLIGRLVKIEE